MNFLIECSKFKEYRNNLFQTVNCNNNKFSKLDNFQKFFCLLTNEDSDILHFMLGHINISKSSIMELYT